MRSWSGVSSGWQCAGWHRFREYTLRYKEGRVLQILAGPCSQEHTGLPLSRRVLLPPDPVHEVRTIGLDPESRSPGFKRESPAAVQPPPALHHKNPSVPWTTGRLRVYKARLAE